MRFNTSTPLLAVGLIFACLGIAGALVPHESQLESDLLLPGSPDSITRTLGAGTSNLTAGQQAAAEEELRRFARRVGGRWRALSWNPVTLTPRLVAGSGVDLGELVGDEQGAERQARAFIDRGATLRGVASERLRTFRIAHGLGKWSVHFRQVAGRYPVIGSRFTVTITETGRVAAFGGDLWPDLQPPDADPALSFADAQRSVRQLLRDRGRASGRIDDREEYTLEKLGILPASASVGHLVYRMRAFVPEPLGAYLIDVDAHSGAIHQVQNVLRTLDFTGTAAGDIEDPGWCFGSDSLPVALMDVTIPGVGSATTDALGAFTIPFSGSEPESIHAEFSGPFFDVTNTNGPDALFSGEAVPGTPFELYWNESNSRFDERDAFYHANNAHEFMKWIDPAWDQMDSVMAVNVNINQSCNAFYYNYTINFFQELGNCANTGRLGDVVHHEYGHGITDLLYGDNDPPSDLHEANSDIIGCYMNDEPQMGRGFYLDDCENGIRNADNDLMWPDDLTGSGHHDGQILSGFYWHGRENLQATLGEEAGHELAAQLWYNARALGLPYTQPEQVWWTFIADDDDGNLDSGTPHHADLAAAAERHGFPIPPAFDDVVIHHLAVPYGTNIGGAPISITARIYSLLGEINPDSLLVYYRPADQLEFSNVLMTAAGADSMYTGEVPNQASNTMLEYYIFAADEMHNHLTDPPGAPGTAHILQVVTVYDPCEGESGWTVGAPGDNATQGIWERVDPAGVTMGGVVIVPEDDTTPGLGTECWVTEQFTGPPIYASDADGQTTLLSPVYDLSSYDWAYVQVQRWFQTFFSGEGTMSIDITCAGGPWTSIDFIEGQQDDPAWETVSADISGLFPTLGEFQLRAVMYGLPYPYSVDEGGLDDLIIIAGVGSSFLPPSPAVAEPTAELHLSARSPLRGGDSISFTIPASGPVQLRILDLTGRVMRTLVDGPLAAGDHKRSWDGTDTSGRPAGVGVYFMRLTTRDGARSCRVIALP